MRRGLFLMCVMAALLLLVGASATVRATPAEQAVEADRIELEVEGPFAIFVNGVEVYRRGAPEPTPVPTEEPTVEPTAIPTEEPTPVPTEEPTVQPPTPTPTTEPTVEPPPGDIAPYPGAPLCGTHDNRKWHSLWNAELGCHYDHHHGDNPRELDYKLGTEIYDVYMGGEISAPWQTVNAEGYVENSTKHAGYIWHVRDNIPDCGQPTCITAFRVMVHQHTILDANVRFHSYVFEGATNDGGSFLVGGHEDFGDLHVPEGNRVIDVQGNHCGSTTNPGNHRQHAEAGGPRAPSNIWYGRSRTVSDPSVDRACGFAAIGVSAQDPWIWSDREGPDFMGDYVCYGNVRCRNNATTFRPHLIGFAVLEDFPFLFEDGVANFVGWADRYGVPYEDGGGCTSASIDCTPFVLRGLAQGGNYGTHGSATEQSYRDYDIYFDNRPAGWAQPVP